MAQAQITTGPRRAEGTRNRLLEAGIAAFGNKPVAAVNLKKDILEPAGISVGSFYHQFKDKGELLVAILEAHSEDLRQRFSEIHRDVSGLGPERIARDSYAMLFDLVDRQPDIIRIQLRGDDPQVRAFTQHDQVLWQRSRATAYKGIAEAYELDVDVEFAAELTGMLAVGAVAHYLAMPYKARNKARARIIEGLVQLTLHGLPGLTRAAAKR